MTNSHRWLFNPSLPLISSILWTGGRVVKLNLLQERWSLVKKPAAVATQHGSDESAPGFKYEVRAEFREAGRTGFDFEEDSAGLVMVRRIRPKSLAAAVPHACEGMTVVRIQSGRGKEREAGGMSYDSVMEMMADRPLVLTFEHPWQRQTDGGTPYYFNILSEESVWDRPPVSHTTVARAAQEVTR